MNTKIITFGILTVVLLFSFVLGSNVAAADYESLSVYFAVTISIYFVVNGWRNVWWFTALLIFSGVVFIQGFIFNSDHLFVLMIALATVMSQIQKGASRKSMIMRHAGDRGLSAVILVLLLYGGLHFGMNLLSPVVPHEYSVKTASKAYFECFGSMAILLWLLMGNYQFRMSPKWATMLILIIFVCLVGNVAMKGLLYLTGSGSASDTLGGGQFATEGFVVPILNMQAGVYSLRNSSPVIIVILGMIMTAPGYFKERKFPMKIVLLSAVFLALIGAVLGGGRVTLPFCLGLLLVVALVRRKFNYVIVTGLMAILLLLLVNIFSRVINEKAPYYVARSLQTIMIEKGRSYDTISGSQDVRNDAFLAAIDEWKSDFRRTIFGRSVYYTSVEDINFIQQNYKDGFVRTTLRSGRTHNLVSDLLLQYGVIGLALYLGAYVTTAVYAIKLYRRIPAELRMVKALSGAVAIYLPFIIVYHLIGGNFLPMVVVLVIGICRSQLSQYEVEMQVQADQDPKVIP